MQCPHCAHLDSIRYGTSRGVQRYRCQACRRIFQTLQRGKDPALKQQVCQLYLEGIGMLDIGLVLVINHKIGFRWLWQALDSTFGKVLGSVFGRRTITTDKVLW